MDFPRLTADTAPLLEAAGLESLRVHAEYTALCGWQLYACAYLMGTCTPVSLVCLMSPAATEAELAERVTDALLDLVPFAHTAQL